MSGPSDEAHGPAPLPTYEAHGPAPLPTYEAIIRSFPGRVLTVTVLCARKRPMSFDSCAPAAAKRSRNDT